MNVHSEKHDEYTRRHNLIWAEMEEVLKRHGVTSYSIFLHPETSQLFAYVELEQDHQWEQIAETEVCQRWWEYMSDLMPTNPDKSPKSVDLNEVFHLE